MLPPVSSPFDSAMRGRLPGGVQDLGVYKVT